MVVVFYGAPEVTLEKKKKKEVKNFQTRLKNVTFHVTSGAP